MGRVQGKIALVTGAGLGLGRAASLLLAEEGAAIFCTDISPEHSKETVRLIRGAGGTADFHELDVCDTGSGIPPEQRARMGPGPGGPGRFGPGGSPPR